MTDGPPAMNKHSNDLNGQYDGKKDDKHQSDGLQFQVSVGNSDDGFTLLKYE